MRRFHFVHAAGLRLDTPFAGVGRVPDRIRDQLAEAPARAWDDLVSFCIDRGVAFLVVAGGILDPAAAATTAPLQFRNGLKRLSEHGVKTYVALGIEDGAVAEVLADARIGGVTVFPAATPATLKVEHGGAAIAAVCGQSASAAGADVEAFFAGAAEGLPLLAVAPGPIDDLDRRVAARGRGKGSYWALGAAAAPSRRGFAPWLVECGALQARDGGQRGARGAMLVSVEGERVLAVDHVPLDRVRYAELSLVPRFPADDALLCHQIMDELNRLRAAHAGRALLVDVVVEGPVAAGGETLLAPQRGRALLQRLREDTAAWDPFVWCSTLRPSAARVQDGDVVTDPLARAVVQQARALLANPLQRSYTFARRFEPLMRRWTSELDTGDAERLIEDATAVALAATRRLDPGSAA